MAITRLQASNTSKVTGGSAAVCSFGSLPNRGSVIAVPVIMRGFIGNEDVSVADNQSNTYHLGADGGNSNDNRAKIYYAYNIGTPSGTFTVTVTASGGTQQTIAKAIEFAGLGSTDPLVGSGTSTAFPPTATTGSTSSPEMAVIGCFASFRLNFDVPTITVDGTSPTWTEEYEQTSTVFGTLVGEADTRVVSSPGAQAISWTANGAANCSNAIIALYSVPPVPFGRFTQQARQTIVSTGTATVKLTQIARQVAYAQTCTFTNDFPPGVTPVLTSGARGIYVPTRGIAGAEGGGGNTPFGALTGRLFIVPPARRNIYVPINAEGEFSGTVRSGIVPPQTRYVYVPIDAEGPPMLKPDGTVGLRTANVYDGEGYTHR
jgi:hypothetical protein